MEQQDKKSSTIAIDIGTTNCRVGLWTNGKFEIIKTEEGQRSIPCCVSLLDDQILVGQSALDQLSKNPKNTIFGINRLLGKPFSHHEFKKISTTKSIPSGSKTQPWESLLS